MPDAQGNPTLLDILQSVQASRERTNVGQPAFGEGLTQQLLGPLVQGGGQATQQAESPNVLQRMQQAQQADQALQQERGGQGGGGFLQSERGQTLIAGLGDVLSAFAAGRGAERVQRGGGRAVGFTQTNLLGELQARRERERRETRQERLVGEARTAAEETAIRAEERAAGRQEAAESRREEALIRAEERARGRQLEDFERQEFLEANREQRRFTQSLIPLLGTEADADLVRRLGEGDESAIAQAVQARERSIFAAEEREFDRQLALRNQGDRRESRMEANRAARAYIAGDPNAGEIGLTARLQRGDSPEAILDDFDLFISGFTEDPIAMMVLRRQVEQRLAAMAQAQPPTQPSGFGGLGDFRFGIGQNVGIGTLLGAAGQQIGEQLRQGERTVQEAERGVPRIPRTIP